MPEKKIIEAVTSTLPVMGSSIATATAGPMPGSTPTAVPRAQPTRHQRRLTGVIASAKPCINALKMSMSEPPRAGEAWQVDGQELSEHPEDRCRDEQARHDVDEPGARRVDAALPARTAQPLHRQQVAQR